MSRVAVEDLRHPLVLEEPLEIADGTGGLSVTWAALGTLWAKMVAGTGRMVRDGAGQTGQVRWKITVRAAPEGAPSRPVSGQRFRLGGRVFAILSVAEADPEARYLTCIAEEEMAP